MKLTKILSKEKWSDIESELYDIYNLQGSVFNVDGLRITKTKNWSNHLCPAIKSTDKGQSYICALAHMNMAKQAMNTNKAVLEECDAGMLKLVVPIFHQGEYLGVLGGCGLLAESGEIDAFAINKITGMQTKEIESLAFDIPILTSKKAQSACEYIEEKLKAVLAEYKVQA